MPFIGIIPDTIEDQHAPPFGFENWCIAAAIVSILTSDATVSGIVSSRVYPLFVPQNATIPAITYQNIVSPRVHTLGSVDDMVPALYQLNCWAETMEGARALSEAVRGALNNYSGTVGGVVIQAVHITDEDDMPAMLAGDDVLERYGKRLDFKVWFNE